MFVITHLQGVVCMHNKGFDYNLQYYYHVIIVPVFIFSVNTHHSYSKHLYRRRLVSNEDLILTSTSSPLRSDRDTQ